MSCPKYCTCSRHDYRLPDVPSQYRGGDQNAGIRLYGGRTYE